MLSLRRDVSLLLEKGHSHARLYSVIMLWNEVEICRQRTRDSLVTQIAVMQTVGILTNGNHTKKSIKEAQENLRTLIRDIQNGSYG